MHVMNPFDNTMDAIVFSCHLKANLNFRVGDDLTLYMHADDLEANIVDMSSFFKTSVSKDKINDKMNLIKSFVIGFLNWVFEKGFKIPVPNNYSNCVKDPKV